MNGRLPRSALTRIPGGHLAHAPARRWNAMCYTLRRKGHPIPAPDGPASTYRTFTQQVVLRRQWCAVGKCQNAAVPGTSNHGLGRAVDSGNNEEADRYPQFGFDKSHSDAPWESWHRTWGGSGSASGWHRGLYGNMTISRGSKGTAAALLNQLLKGTGWLPRKRNLHRHFGAQTQRAVKRFQRAHHLHADGIVGPTTWTALFKAYDRKHKH